MNESVFIKGNKYGIKINIDSSCELNDAYKELKEKLISGKKFFGSSSVSLEIDYKFVDEKIQKEIIKLIEENTDLNVFCVVDENMELVAHPDLLKKEDDCVELNEILIDKDKLISELKHDLILKENQINDLKESLSKAGGNIADISSKTELAENLENVKSELDEDIEYAKFFQGTLRSGQQVKIDNSIVLLGDVNPGAKIISTGNIIVLGSMRGFAHAGATGKSKASIFALDLRPTQLRIAEFIARAPESYEGSGASIAFVENDGIMIDKIDKGLLKDFVLLK